MADCKTLSLTPATRAILVSFATRVPLRPSATNGVPDPEIMSLPTSVAGALSALGLGPSGFARDRDSASHGPWSFDQPAFVAQFVVAYHALANMLPGTTSRDDLDSYGLKHAVASVWLDAGNGHPVYLSNGALITAALAHEYRVRRRPAPDDINAAVRLRRDWRQVMLHNLRAVAVTGGFDL